MFDFMNDNSQLEQSRQIMDSLFKANEQSLQMDIMRDVADTNARMIADQQLHLNNYLYNQSWRR